MKYNIFFIPQKLTNTSKISWLRLTNLQLCNHDKFIILTANIIKTAQFALFRLLKNLKNQQINYKIFNKI